MKVSCALATAALFVLSVVARFVLKQFTRPVVFGCTTTLRLFRFRVSVERSCPFTHANCFVRSPRQRRRITALPILLLATKGALRWIASGSLSSGAHSRVGSQ